MPRPVALALALVLAGCGDAGLTALSPSAARPGANTVTSDYAVVTNLNDDGPGSLRWAITTIDAPVIRFAPGVEGDLVLTGGTLVIDRNAMIVGPGADRLRIVRPHGYERLRRVFQIGSKTVVTLSGLTITGGSVNDDYGDSMGGGIWNSGDLTLDNCVVTENFAFFDGGGIYNMGRLTLRGSRLSSNRSYHALGGAIGNVGMLFIDRSTLIANRTSDGAGGAIGSRTGVVVISNSSLLDNSSGMHGGVAIHLEDGELYVGNSTISGNHAADIGSAIELDAGKAVISGSTIVLNSGSPAGGIRSHGSLALYNTVVALNAPGTWLSDMFVTGDLTVGHSIIGTPIRKDFDVPGTGYPMSANLGGNILGVTATQLALGPLADNGGPTLTHLLLAGSVAIDAGKARYVPIEWDQRGIGYPRKVGVGPDIGATESKHP